MFYFLFDAFAHKSTTEPHSALTLIQHTLKNTQKCWLIDNVFRQNLDIFKLQQAYQAVTYFKTTANSNIRSFWNNSSAVIEEGLHELSE